MGKAQSKRSVDITTQPKKDVGIEEGTGELKKIEEVDFKAQPVNGDTTAHVNETTAEKPSTETTETENEKDLSTEKELQRVTETNEAAGGDAAAPENSASDSKVDENVADKSTIESAEDSVNESKSVTTSGSETPDSTSKKPKKEKVKKKWSFRSISFGKKDKQKPSKKEEGAVSPNTSAVNGECEKVPEEGTEEAVPAVEKKDDAVAPVEVTVTAAEEIKAIAEEPQPLKEETNTVNETSSLVLNGVSEAKEEISAAVEKESEKIVETVQEVKELISVTESPIIENKTPEPVTNGDKHHDEISSKMNGSFEAPKTEVKNDDILIAKELQILDIIKEQNDENIVQNINSTNELKNLDGESTLPLPPPLPSTLPPSQVMVFALSETTQEQKNETDVILPLATDIPISPPPVVEENLIPKKLDCLIDNLKNDDVTNDLKNDENLINDAISNEEPSGSTPNKKDESCNLVEAKLAEINESVNKDLESHVEILDEKSELESAPTTVDQLVDDIIEEVSVDLTAQLVENILQEKVIEEENISNEAVEKVETILFDEIHNDIINGGRTDVENSITMDSPIQNDNEKITESSIDDDLPSPPPTPPTYVENNSLVIDNQNNTVDMNLINVNFDKMSLQNNENKTDLTASDVSAKSNNEGTDNPNEDTINTHKAGAQKNQHNQNNKKENGIDDNYQNNETSATENLNGVDHNKTIEEIKAENQQLDKSAAEITQDTAIIAAE